MRNSLRRAFDQIKADDALLEHTMEFLRGEMAKRQSKRRRFSKTAAVLCGCAASVLLMLGALLHQLHSFAQTYVSIDVNPSVEFSLNGFDRVIDAYAYNEDGELLLDGIDIKGEKYDAALAALLTQMERGGYIAPGGLVSVTVQTANAQKESALCRSLQNTAERFLTQTPDIEVFPVTREVLSNAHGCHMTPARYLAIRELMEVDETATLEQYNSSTIGQIRQRTQQCRAEHEGHASQAPPGNGNSSVGQGGGHGHGHHGGRK